MRPKSAFLIRSQRETDTPYEDYYQSLRMAYVYFVQILARAWHLNVHCIPNISETFRICQRFALRYFKFLERQNIKMSKITLNIVVSLNSVFDCSGSDFFDFNPASLFYNSVSYFQWPLTLHTKEGLPKIDSEISFWAILPPAVALT